MGYTLSQVICYFFWTVILCGFHLKKRPDKTKIRNSFSSSPMEEYFQIFLMLSWVEKNVWKHSLMGNDWYLYSVSRNSWKRAKQKIKNISSHSLLHSQPILNQCSFFFWTPPDGFSFQGVHDRTLAPIWFKLSVINPL